MYDAFGNRTRIVSPPVALGYQGQYQGAVVVEAGARSYAPQIGQFLQGDTWTGDPTNPITLNRYTYANADPINTWDPSGYGWLGDAWDATGGKVVSAADDAWDAGYDYATERARSARQKADRAKKALSDFYDDIQEAADAAIEDVGDQWTQTTNWVDDRAESFQASVDDFRTGLREVREWASEHKTDLLAGAAGLLVGAACTGLTGGAGVVGCAALAGAVTGGLTGYANNCTSGQSTSDCLIGIGTGAVIGGAIGGATAGLGKFAVNTRLGQTITNRTRPTSIADDLASTSRTATRAGGGAVDDVATSSKPWLRGSSGNAGRVPDSVRTALEGQTFSSREAFRSSFWQAAADDPALAGQFSRSNVSLMSSGRAPIAPSSQHFAGRMRYELHHITPVSRGGGAYDLDNIIVATPRYHHEVLSPSYHYGGGG
jgi:RHS repeat-associated protein